MLSSLKTPFPPAILALADGTVFPGYAFGAVGHTVGEVVFNTALTGYQEILTDPSYCQQIVTLTYPHIGNTGFNTQDFESDRIHAAGLIVRDVPLVASNFRSESTLSDALRQAGTVAIAGVDTRALTRHLRTQGAQNGCILTLASGQAITPTVRADAVARARAAAPMAGLDLAQVVSRGANTTWSETEWALSRPELDGRPGYGTQTAPHHHVVAVDLGVKRNILRMLAARGCRITVVPAQTSAQAIQALGPDGVFFSNGPGDPEPCGYAIAAAADCMARGVPTFGICLGHQVMALASGARTYKMKFGHHGANHPVKDLDSGRVCITSQNHGFAVDADSLPSHLRVTHRSLFDATVQGLARTDCPAFSFQGHPEASPGPHDIAYLFDRFVSLMGVRA